jgi:hypothetical protein
VATLVATGWHLGRCSRPSQEVVLFDVAAVTLNRYEADATVVIADRRTLASVGSRWPLDGEASLRVL